MGLESCVFEQRGYIFSTEEGFICEKGKFVFHSDLDLFGAESNHATAVLTTLYQAHPPLENYIAFVDMEEKYPGFNMKDFPEMLQRFLDGQMYITPKLRAGARRIRFGMSEIQIGVEFADLDSYALKSWPHYIVFPLRDADCEITFRDKLDPDKCVTATWKNGKLASISEE